MREAIAKEFGSETVILEASDIIMASACSGAIELSINVLCSPGDCILLPEPGFSLYQTICRSRGIQCLYYNCLPEKSWEIDLTQLESLLKSHSNIKALLVNNPSNPCGSAFSLQHMHNILRKAEQYKIPIISDEVYHGMVFEHAQFYPFGHISKNVPVLTCGGLAKRYMVPGWRIGWVIVYDKHNAFQQVRKGLQDLATVLLGPNSVIQSAIPEIFKNTPKNYFSEINKKLEVAYIFKSHVLFFSLCRTTQ